MYGKVVQFHFARNNVDLWSIPNGIGRLKTPELQHYQSPVALCMMRAIKQALDPLGIMNPGCILPSL